MFGKFEPIINAQTISTVLSALLTLLVAFNVPITDDQRTALLAMAAAIGGIFWVGSLAARSQTTSVAKVEENIIPLVAPANQPVALHSLKTGTKSARAEVLAA